jgi:putative ABC transport system ATP-binding protein
MFEFIDVKFKDVLEIPSLIIQENKTTTLFGPSGSGKTTALRLLNKMISPTTGKILLHGLDLKDINSVAHRRKCIMLSQNPVIFEGNIRDNLNIAFKFQERKHKQDKELLSMLQKVKLNKNLDEIAEKLSGGEKQRLALARVMLLEPDIYLLDEPSSSLDDETEEFIIDMLTKHVKEREKTIILVTHSKKTAKKYSDTIVHITEDGKTGMRYENG